MKVAKVASKWVVMGDSDDSEHLATCDTEGEAVEWMKANPSKAKTDSKRVMRVDMAGTLKAPVRMPNGYLKVDGYLTRTGVFLYRNDDGSERRELRLAEDVFAQDSLDSFAMAPVTDDHPPVFLTSKNTSEYQRGHVGDSVVRDGKLMRAPMMITDAGLIAKLEKGRAVEISNGYTCALEEKSGITDDGERFDCIQRDIVANHVAIVSTGRAGPDARVRMDSGADVLISIARDGIDPSHKPAPPEKNTVKKIRIDGVEYEAGSEQAVMAQANYQSKLDAEAKTRADADAKRAESDAKRDAELKTLQAESEKNKARADAAAEAHTKLEAELKAALAKVAAELKARIKLEDSAKLVLGEKAARKFDAMDDKAIKIAVVKHANPELKLDGKSDAYVDARFDLAIEQHEAEHDDAEGDDEDGITAARRGVNTDEDNEDAEPGDPAAELNEAEANAPHTDSASAREAMEWRHRNQWRQPIGNERAS